MTSTDLARLQGELALLEAVEPQRQAAQATKDTLREALDSGDADAVAAARTAKNDAAVALRNTRQWLRRESAVAQIPRDIARIDRVIANKEYDDAAHLAQLKATRSALKAELPRLEALVAETRAALVALGGDLSAAVDASESDDVVSVSAPTVSAKGKANRAGGA